MPILGNCFLIDWKIAMRTADLLAAIDSYEFLHAGRAAGMLIDAHHHGRIFVLIELSHA
jgi:hypothetical protein